MQENLWYKENTEGPECRYLHVLKARDEEDLVYHEYLYHPLLAKTDPPVEIKTTFKTFSEALLKGIYHVVPPEQVPFLMAL